MSKIAAIFSTKGGVGKTFIATNLAVSLGVNAGKKVALVDLDLQAVGDTTKLLNVSPRKSMLDLFESLKRNPEGTVLEDYVVRMESYRTDYLPAVLSLRQAPHINSEKITTVITFLEKHYDYIIIDAGKAFTESLFTVFNFANLIMLVVTPDVLSVYQTKWALDILQSLHIPLNMIKLVLNRSQSVGAVSWQEVRAAVPCDIISRLPSDGKLVGMALNRGIPVVVDAPRSKISEAVRELEKALVENEGLFLKHGVSLSGAGVEGMLAEEGIFLQKYELSRAPAIAEEGDKETDEIIELKRRIHAKLIDKLDLKRLEIDITDKDKTKAIREKTEAIITNALSDETGVFLSSFDVRKKLVKEIADEALGLGALEDLIGDPDISDIMVNNKNQIYIERHGKIELSPKRFISNEQVRQVIERIIAPLGRRIDESVPMVDARLPDGSRVNAIIPPLALTGPTLTIRKFGRERLTIDDLIRLGALNDPIKQFIAACVISRKNMIVSGGTGSGKTTVLNCLSTFIPESERILTLEDAAELKLKQEHWVRLESRPPNIEGKGAITIRELFRNTLRMRPDRIIIGECRGAEALDMLQAMNTGHDGSMTTIHANSTHDVLSRLDSMILMSGADLPVRSIREMISSAINMIIHTARLADGTRKIMQITEITGMLDETHIGMKDIFSFKQTGLSPEGKVMGHFLPSGYIPDFVKELKYRGITLSEEVFKPSV